MLGGKKIGFIGTGNMGAALIRGLIQSRLLAAQDILVEDILVHDAVPDKAEQLRAAHGVVLAPSNRDLANKAQVVMLCVKPQAVDGVLDEIEDMPRDHLVISICAGITLEYLETRLPMRPIVRVMPNTPALVLEAASALAKGMHATAEHLVIARALFDAVGRAVVVDESLMDAVTGLSGSGPAYIFTIIEALTDAGVNLGLPRPQAQELAAQTVLGSAKMVLEGVAPSPAELRAMVASPGGTTIRGLQIMERAGIRGIIMDTVEAAAKRSRKLGRRGRQPDSGARDA
ncbi:MAG: pyrroline-5-carboxylate reductase [Pseudomonadota bacterium]